VADDRAYMLQHAVWRAHAENRLSAIPVSGTSVKGMFRYHRVQVRRIAREAGTVAGD
jgi:hypothetical protein